MCKSKAEPLRQLRNENKQSNNNKNIDQSTGAAWLQFNWASFGSGISSVLVIIALLVLLFIYYKKNKRATRKARKAEMHEMFTLASRGRRHSNSAPSPSTSSGYPGPRSASASAGGFPSGLPHACGAGMQQFYPGSATFSSGCGPSPFSPAPPTIQFPGLHFSGLPGINYSSPTPQAVGYFPREDWTRIQELPRSAPAPRSLSLIHI